MGTSGLLGHILRRQCLRKGVVHHHSSYPAYLGTNIAEFVNKLTAEQIEKMQEMVAQIQWIDKDAEEPPSKELQERFYEAGMTDRKTGNDWYSLYDKAQGVDILPYILDGTCTHLPDETNFEDNTLFCEWTYFIDWEDRTVHVRHACLDLFYTASVAFKKLSPQWMEDFEEEAHAGISEAGRGESERYEEEEEGKEERWA